MKQRSAFSMMTIFRSSVSLKTILTVLVVLSSSFIFAQKVDIDTLKLRENIEILASDEMKGRFPGEGGVPASDHIHKVLTEIGAEPMCDNGFQPFQVIQKVSFGDQNSFSIKGEELNFGKDYAPYCNSMEKAVSGKVAFVGFGLDVEDENGRWNDYADVKVKGRWVLVVDGLPLDIMTKQNFKDAASIQAKAVTAKDHGAIGMILVKADDRFSDKMEQTEGRLSQIDGSLPVTVVSKDVADRLIGDPSVLEDVLAKTSETDHDLSRKLKSKVEIRNHIVKEGISARNVVFEIKSETPSDQYVVIGGHYDHLGMGGGGSRTPDTVAVHNGADDNASGTAGVIELARYFQKRKSSLKKNLIFIAFDAEELGLRGSKYFVDNSPVPTSSMTTMINLDMIGRMDTRDKGIVLYGTGTAEEFKTLLKETDAFPIAKVESGFGPSDHTSFYGKDIPVLFATTGLHTDYHTPADDVELLSIDRAGEVLQYVAEIVTELTSDNEALSLVKTKAPKRTMTKIKVTLGIMPDVGGVVKGGLGVEGVKPGGPAAVAGIKKGDKIVAINGMKVGNIYEYMSRLSKVKANTVGEVKLVRDGKEQVVSVQF